MMKRLKFIWLCLAIIFIGGACSNDFDLVDEWEDIPIVYGFLSRQDDDHFIRIEKAFLDPRTSAFVIAQNPDSIYYDNIAVQLERLSTGQVYNLEQVDGRDFGIPREPGIFANEPNYIYRINTGGEELAGGEEYELTINRGDNLPVVTARTVVVSDFRLTNPTVAGSLDWVNSIAPQRVTWKVEEDAYIFDFRIIMHIRETDPEDPNTLIERSLEWQVRKNIRAEKDAGSDPPATISIPRVEFYNFLRANLEVDPRIDRFFDSYDYVVDAGGQEILEFANVNNANTGITSSQAIPVYTNLSEGRGIFTSRNSSTIQGFTLQSQSLDTLRMGSITRDLNFR